MHAMLSPDRSPARLLAPGLLAAVLCSSALACLQAVSADVPQGLGISGSALLVVSGISGAFGGFFAVLLYSVLIWTYGRAIHPSNAGFVRTLAVVALALGTTLVLQLAVVGVEALVTGVPPTLPFTNLSRYLGSSSSGLDLLNLVTIGIVYVGSRRYLGYSSLAAGVLALLMLVINTATGVLL